MPNLILAPIRGVTSCLFRNVFAGHFSGFDSAVTPFITTTHGNPASISHFKDILPENNHSWQIIPQLIGNDPDDFIRTAGQIHDMGYPQVDLNLGCPMPTVTRKMRGSALLSEPERLFAFLDKVMAALPCRLSLKTRLGYESGDELKKIIPALNDYPLAAITIHPRTAGQLYTGTVDLDRFEECLAMLSHPVIYSGDITTAGVYNSLQKRFPAVSSWMIGRGAVADPFLPMRIKQIPLQLSPEIVLKSFHKELFARYREILHGPAHQLGAMKEIWTYLAAGVGDNGKGLKKIYKAKTIEAYTSAVEEIFKRTIAINFSIPTLPD
jgi:tRNA-dihydrouridine synthase